MRRQRKLILALGALFSIGTLGIKALAQDHDPGLVIDIIELSNAQRRANGLPELRPSGTLMSTAQYHSDDQSNRNYIGHNTPEGVTPRDRMLRSGYDANTYTGENIYNGYGSDAYTSPTAAVNWWMNSPGHRANILDPRYTEIGVGLAITTATGMHIYVQNFGSAATSGAGGWGAIAYSPSQGVYGVASAKASATDAAAGAMQSCSGIADDCVATVSYRVGCGVVKRDPVTGAWGAAQAGGSGMPAINAAGGLARRRCVEAGGQACNDLVVATCSR